VVKIGVTTVFSSPLPAVTGRLLNQNQALLPSSPVEIPFTLSAGVRVIAPGVKVKP
jgi:hypothetical protein